MNPQLHQRLKDLDEIGDWESPPGLDFLVAAREIESHKPALERILGRPLKLEGSQDASYLGDLFVQDQHFVNMKGGDLTVTAIIQIICVRFSAFDRMFTIFGTEIEKFSAQVPAVILHLENHGFKYVSRDELSAPYDGVITDGTEDWTWFTRFFDYL